MVDQINTSNRALGKVVLESKSRGIVRSSDEFLSVMLAIT